MNLRILSVKNAAALRAEIEKIHANAARAEEFVARGIFHVIKLEGVNIALAFFLLQELRTEGGEVVISSGLRVGQQGTMDLLLMGTLEQLRHLSIRLRTQEHDFSRELAADLDTALDAYHAATRGTLEIGPRRFEWGVRTYVMGIVNVTPDSFSGDGVLRRDAEGDGVELALAQAMRMADEGVDIVDIGGESTRPSSIPISLDEELRRVIPVIKRLACEIEIPISIDTYKAEVAKQALDAGAHLVNDVWGGRMDAAMLPLIAERGVPIVIMHNRCRIKDVGSVEYTDLMADILRELREQIQTAINAGIEGNRIIIDPGFGFGKTREYNMELLQRLDELRVLGYPILVGPSRKPSVDYTAILPPQARVEGTAAAVVLSIAGGADLVRVHAVQATVRAARLADAVVRRKTYG